jgi:hypothetical protein
MPAREVPSGSGQFKSAGLTWREQGVGLNEMMPGSTEPVTASVWVPGALSSASWLGANCGSSLDLGGH